MVVNDQLHSSTALLLGDRTPNIHFTGDFVVSTTGLVVVEKRKICFHCCESNPDSLDVQVIA
jgi:hypothetical protein